MIKLIKTLFNGKKEDNNSDSNEKNDLLSLAPTPTADNIKTYVPFLDSALEDKDENGNIVNKNIAVTGGYGSGKSSIIKSYFENKRKDKYKGRVLYITLGNYVENSCAPLGEETKEEKKFYTYKDGVDEKNEKDKKIENKTVKTVHKSNSTDDQVEISILQQILYYVRPKRIPFSRFHRIDKHNDKLDEIIYNLISLIIVILISFVYILIFKSKSIYDFKDIIFDRYCILSGIVLFFPSYFIISYVNRRFKVNKISFDNLELSKGGIDESILNKYLDELIHFFLYNKYDIVIFDDLDRLDNCKLFFSKLKEINTILNNSISNKTIRFIYAVRDDLFDDCEKRTKFVDVIIPIIPFFESYGNIKMFEENSNILKYISKETKKCISKYIKNARYFKDVMNELKIYKNNYLHKNSIDEIEIEDLEQLFWLVSYKVFYPKRFQLLVDGESILFYILDKELMKNIYIDKREKELELIDELSVKNKENIDIMNNYIKELLEIQKKVNLNKVISSKEYSHFRTRNKQIIDLEQILRLQDGYNLLFEGGLIGLEDEINNRNGELLFSKYEKALTAYKNFVNTINKIKALNDNINKNYHLDSLIEKIKENTINKECKELNDFEKEMIKMKKIRLNYRNFIINKISTLRYSDERFILNISKSEEINFKYCIIEVAEVFDVLSPVDFVNDGICNYYLFDYINNDDIDAKLYYDVFFENLTNTKLVFLTEYLGEHFSFSCLNKLSKYLNFIWNYLLSMNYVDEILDFWIYITTLFNENLIMSTHVYLSEAIKKHNNIDDVFEKFILENQKKDCIGETLNKRLMDNLVKLQFDYNWFSEYKIKNINFLNIIYDNSLFGYNINLIRTIVELKGIKFDKDKLLRIIYDNKVTLRNIYMYIFKNFIIALENFQRQLYMLEKDDELFRYLFLTDFMNFDDMKKLIQNSDFVVDDLSVIPAELLDTYIDLHDFDVNWNNILFLLKIPKYRINASIQLNYKIELLMEQKCCIKTELTETLSNFLDDFSQHFIEKLINYNLLQTNDLEILWKYKIYLKDSLSYPKLVDSCLALLKKEKKVGLIVDEIAIDLIEKSSNKLDAIKFLIKHIQENNYSVKVKNKISDMIVKNRIVISKSVCENLIKDIDSLYFVPFGKYCSSKYDNIIKLLKKSNEFQKTLSYSSCNWPNNDDNLWFANVLKENKLGEYKIENNKIEMTIY